MPATTASTAATSQIAIVEPACSPTARTYERGRYVWAISVTRACRPSRCSADLEAHQSLGLLGGLVDRLHVRAARAPRAPLDHRAHRGGVALEHRLDRSVW